MKEELELQLVTKYPKILRDYGGDIMKTAMHFGFQHGDGWYKLLDETLGKIQYLCDLFTKENLDSGQEFRGEIQLIADTFKEKYGTLRFYYDLEGNSSDIHAQILDIIVSEAERRSEYICENTGESGALCNRGGWYKTLCRQEAKKYGYVAVDKGLQEYWESENKDENK